MKVLLVICLVSMLACAKQEVNEFVLPVQRERRFSRAVNADRFYRCFHRFKYGKNRRCGWFVGMQRDRNFVYQGPWAPGDIQGHSYLFVPPESFIKKEYKGTYPYWGYGLGIDNYLDTLARRGKWQDVVTALFNLRDYYSKKLDMLLLQKRGVKKREVHKLEHLIDRVQYHIDGLPRKHLALYTVDDYCVV